MYSQRSESEFWLPRTGLFIALFLVSGNLSAQSNQRVSETNSPALRGQCQAAAQLLRDGRVTPANAAKVRDLRQCRESAGSVLPAAWLTAQPDSTEIATLIIASSSVRDARIANALETILKDGKRDAFVRQAAAVVLLTYARGNVLGGVTRSTVQGEQWIVEVGLTAGLASDDAPTPPDTALVQRLGETLEEVAGPLPRRTSLQKVAALLLAYLKS